MSQSRILIGSQSTYQSHFINFHSCIDHKKKVLKNKGDKKQKPCFIFISNTFWVTLYSSGSVKLMNFLFVLVCYLTIYYIFILRTAETVFCWRLHCIFVMQEMILRYFHFFPGGLEVSGKVWNFTLILAHSETHLAWVQVGHTLLHMADTKSQMMEGPTGFVFQFPHLHIYTLALFTEERLVS